VLKIEKVFVKIGKREGGKKKKKVKTANKIIITANMRLSDFELKRI